MATLIIPDTWLVAINAESNGQQVTAVIGITAEFQDSNTVAAAVKAAWEAAGGPLSQHNTSYIMQDYTVTDLSSPTGMVAVVASSAAGPLGGALATNASCALVSYGAGTRSRSQRGRLYHGPLTEVHINPDGRTLTAAAITSFRNAYEQFRDQLTTAGMNWCVISRKNLDVTVIQDNTLSVQTVIATQRRRIRGR